MLSTQYVPGAPCWLDLGAPDVTAAADFYGKVFGWETEFMDMGDGRFGLCRTGGRTVGGIGPLTEKGARPAWMLYFHTPDADAVAAAVQQAGGTVRVPPTDADGQGRMAQFTDPQGGQFAVWQPGENQGIETVNEPGALSWTELYTTDAAAAKEFYGGLLGWTFDGMPVPGDASTTYWMITPAGQDQERMQGGLMQVPGEALAPTGGRPYWHPVFTSEDCDATVAKVTANGGSVQMGPETAEGVGRLAVCLDPSGADFVVLTPAAM